MKISSKTVCIGRFFPRSLHSLKLVPSVLLQSRNHENRRLAPSLFRGISVLRKITTSAGA